MQNAKSQRKNLPKLAMAPVAMVYSTIVENIRQIGLFMQNKANFRKSQMDITLIITSVYEKNSHWTFGENKPIQSQSQNGCCPRISAKRSGNCLSSWIRIRATVLWVGCGVSL